MIIMRFEAFQEFSLLNKSPDLLFRIPVHSYTENSTKIFVLHTLHNGSLVGTLFWAILSPRSLKNSPIWSHWVCATNFDQTKAQIKTLFEI